MKTKLTDITDVVRSKNSGPYELTLDIMFKTFEDFEKVCAAKAINEKLICDLYKITPDKTAKSIKVTIKRPICSGDLGETDVYGAQQHAPLLDVVLDI